jgi:Pyruvate/2-oxoacid:ferredoxin oxidoreductase delta subunit
MDRPCIVCQETCPVSPKAIYLKDTIETIRDGMREVITSARSSVRIAGPALSPGRLGSGAHVAFLEGAPDQPPRRILGNTTDTVALDSSIRWPADPRPGDHIRLAVRLRLPFVDPDRCTGCGICEHECPVTGLRAIRITAENESRSRVRGLIKG